MYQNKYRSMQVVNVSVMLRVWVRDSFTRVCAWFVHICTSVTHTNMYQNKFRFIQVAYVESCYIYAFVTHSYVCVRDSYIYAPELVPLHAGYVCVIHVVYQFVDHSHVRVRDSHVCVPDQVPLYVGRVGVGHVADHSDSYVWVHDSLICMRSWLIYVCTRPRSALSKVCVSHGVCMSYHTYTMT